jgi:hypothetical protein
VKKRRCCVLEDKIRDTVPSVEEAKSGRVTSCNEPQRNEESLGNPGETVFSLRIPRLSRWRRFPKLATLLCFRSSGRTMENTDKGHCYADKLRASEELDLLRQLGFPDSRRLRSLRSISTAKTNLLPNPYSHNSWIKNGDIPSTP